jgi:hypothetical protein
VHVRFWTVLLSSLLCCCKPHAGAAFAEGCKAHVVATPPSRSLVAAPAAPAEAPQVTRCCSRAGPGR